MKKLMMMLAAVVLAATTQAAVVSWGSGAFAGDGAGVAITAAGKVTGYLYALTATDYATYAAMDAETLSKTVGAAFAENSLGTAEATAANTYSSRGGAAVVLSGTSSYNAGDTAYGLILYVDAANEMYMANVAEFQFASAQNGSVANLANIIGGGTTGAATSWQAVPEPTSGLLMLVGLAGLALRRRRA